MSAKLHNDIVIMGDIHGEFGKLNKFINTKQPKMIIQVGDFGYWPRWNTETHKKEWAKEDVVKAQNTIIHFCDGNHEDHWALRDRTTDELYPNTFYQPRGSYITLEDGRNVMFFGGAESIDKDYRVLGHDWFPEETITQKDMFGLPDIKVDIMITHTCPHEFEVKCFAGEAKSTDPSKMALSYLLDRYKPDHWYFGHYHVKVSGKHDNTKWHCIDMSRNSQWWVKLPE
jgi:Icc-related predicted phosphoesterase